METKVNSNAKRTVIKISLVAVISLLLLIPLAMIKGVIEDREQTKDSVTVEVANSYAKPQTVSAPYLVSYVVETKTRTKVELSINSQDRPYYQRVLSSASWSYTWGNGRYSNFALRPIDLTLIKVGYIDPEFLDRLQNPYLRNSYSQQLIAGISGSYVFNNQIRNINGNATNLRFNWETAGNLVGALSHLLSKPAADRDHYNVFGIRYSQYFRTDLSFSRKEVLGAKTALAYRLYAGAGLAYGNSTEIPIDRLFYAGGSNSMRGWAARTLGPGGVAISDDQRIYPSQVGNMKIEANLEFRFPIWSILLVEDVLHIDILGSAEEVYIGTCTHKLLCQQWEVEAVGVEATEVATHHKLTQRLSHLAECRAILDILVGDVMHCGSLRRNWHLGVDTTSFDYLLAIGHNLHYRYLDNAVSSYIGARGLQIEEDHRALQI